MTITWEEFEQVNIRSGTIVKIEEFSRARKPAFKVWADFGPEIGILQTSAQITVHYTPETLIGRSIMGCINLGEKNIAGSFHNFYFLALQMKKVLFALSHLPPKHPME
jgi:tRNA-binding protein